MKKLLLISLVLIGCSKDEVGECCKTVIDTDYRVIMSGGQLGARVWSATYLDCNNQVTRQEAQYPSSNSPFIIGETECN